MSCGRVDCDRCCEDVYPAALIPPKDCVDPSKIKVLMISESAPAKCHDYFYGDLGASFFKNTQRVFADAGIAISDYQDLEDLGVYLTVAVKCVKRNYTLSAKTIKTCAFTHIELEIDRYPNIDTILCMGDVAIKAVNYIYKKKEGNAPIPKGSTYRIRKDRYVQGGIAFLPSYTQTGSSFDIEKSKRQMIAEDIQSVWNRA